MVLACSRFAAHIIFMSALAILVIGSFVDPGAAFAGFASSGLWTIAALFVVVAGVRQTGVLDWLGAYRWPKSRMGGPSTNYAANGRASEK